MSTKNFLTEKMLLDTQHGKNCTLEVCVAGEPDADELIFTGSVSDCLRKSMTHELAMTGDQYFSLTTRQDNYCGLNFEELAFRMGHNPEALQDLLGVFQTDSLRQDALCVDDIDMQAMSDRADRRLRAQAREGMRSLDAQISIAQSRAAEHQANSNPREKDPETIR